MRRTEPTGPTGPVLRAARPEDAAAMARVHLSARAHAPMPPADGEVDEVTAWLRAGVAADCCHVAESGGQVVGYVRHTATWLDDLYVAPARAGAGIGSALLHLVMDEVPDGFGLWVFESNVAAREFYRRRGLLELERTDGRANCERAPDIRMVWPGRDPRRHLRDLAEETELQLAELRLRRERLALALTAHCE